MIYQTYFEESNKRNVCCVGNEGSDNHGGNDGSNEKNDDCYDGNRSENSIRENENVGQNGILDNGNDGQNDIWRDGNDENGDWEDENCGHYDGWDSVSSGQHEDCKLDGEMTRSKDREWDSPTGKVGNGEYLTSSSVRYSWPMTVCSLVVFGSYKEIRLTHIVFFSCDFLHV